MTDFDYDVLQKKRIASGAYHVKKGSRSKKCTLPSDYLTAKQKRELNGKMDTFDLSKPMSWAEFKFMPKDLQEEYLLKLIDEFNASQRMVAKMFGISDPTLSIYLRRIGIRWGRGDSKPATKDEVRRFDEFAGLSKPVEEAPEPEEPAPAVTTTETPAVTPPKSPAVLSGTLTLQGNAADICSKLVSWLGVSGTYTVTVEFVADEV